MSTDPTRINPALTPPLESTAPPKGPATPVRTSDGKTFGDVLRTKVAQTVTTTPQAAPDTQSIKFSAHAAARLQQRGIELSESHMQRLQTAVDKAAAKGARESLVLMDEVAMVVSVKNRTVITALAREQAKENVFTNIDSAVIA